MHKNRLFWGIVVILVGVYFLLNQLFPLLHLGNFFWAIILIFIGLWLLVGPMIFKRKLEEETISIPLDNASSARIKLRHGAGQLEVHGQDDSSQLLSGTFFGGAEQEVEHHGNQTKVRLKTPSDVFSGFEFTSTEGLQWNVGLNRDIPIELDIKGGASDTMLNLADMKITSLRIETGASSTKIGLPAQAGFTQVEIHAGAASINIHIPEGVAAKISTKTGLSSCNIDTNRFINNGQFYLSPDYETAINKAEINVEAGVGSLDIH